MRVVGEALAVALLLDPEQHLDILAVLVAAGLLVALHPGLDLVLPQRGGLRQLQLRGGAALRGVKGRLLKGEG